MNIKLHNEMHSATRTNALFDTDLMLHIHALYKLVGKAREKDKNKRIKKEVMNC